MVEALSGPGGLPVELEESTYNYFYGMLVAKKQ